MRSKVYSIVMVGFLISALAGCSENKDFEWYDTTGQSRSSDTAMVDKEACEKANPISPPSAGSTEFQYSRHRFELCMESRGWRLR